MAKSETMSKELEKLGWHLTAEGLARCEALCEQKNFKPTAKNVEKVALDLDLRSIGEQALSDDVARNTKHEVEGPLVLQVQRVRNVALPSTRQFSGGSSRRLLRVQLTDGRVSLGGVEMDGAIPGLSTQSPPGTKVLLLQKVEAQKGFLLLGKNSLKVLGGQVQHLVQKWSLTKIMPDELGRSAGGSNDAPQFIQFGKSAGVKTAKGQDQLKHHENKKSSVSTREAAVSSMTREDEREKMEMPLSEEITFRKTPQNREINQSRGGRGQYGRPTTEGARNYRGDTGEGSDGRGRGRGRRGRREREDCYDQGRKSESSMLSDWLEQKLTVSSNYERQQPDMGRGGEEEYWEEVWAYQESLAIAESKEQWKREEREREERAGVTRRGGWGNEGEMREGGGGRGVQGGRESETDYRSHGGRGSGTLTSQQYEDNDDGSGGGRLGQRHRFERRENEDRPRGRGGGRRGGGGGRQEHSSNEQQYYGGRERGGRERRGDDFRATGQKSEFGNNWQDQRREFFTEEFGHSKQQHYSGGRGRGVGGERGQKQSGRKDFGSRSEQPKMLERDSRTEEQAGSNEEWPSVSVSATVAAAPSSTENQQYNWGWVKKGAPLRAKKVGL